MSQKYTLLYILTTKKMDKVTKKITVRIGFMTFTSNKNGAGEFTQNDPKLCTIEKTVNSYPLTELELFTTEEEIKKFVSKQSPNERIEYIKIVSVFPLASS